MEIRESCVLLGFRALGNPRMLGIASRCYVRETSLGLGGVDSVRSQRGGRIFQNRTGLHIVYKHSWSFFSDFDTNSPSSGPPGPRGWVCQAFCYAFRIFMMFPTQCVAG